MATHFNQYRLQIILFVLAFCPMNFGVAAEFGTNYEQITTKANGTVPTVTLTGNSTVQNNQQLTLAATASYCSGCTPFYYWYASGGSFQGTENSPNVVWIPPVTSTTQTYNISVTVGDNNGKEASANLPVTVTSTTTACTANIITPNIYSSGLWMESSYVTIDWEQINNATGYVLQESMNGNFTNNIQFINNGAENHSLTLYSKSNGTYYYRVKAFNSCGESGWSNVSTQIVKANAPPNIPSSPSPATGSHGASRTPTLTWSGGDSDGEVEYAIEMGTDPNSMWLVQGFGNSNSYSTSKLIDWSLNPSTTYYWRVRSKDDHGALVIGPTWSFTTASFSADLVPISATLSGNIANDNTVTMTVVVQNQGDYASDGGVLRFYYSPYENGYDWEYPGRWKGLPVLQPGASTAINMDLPISGLLPGESYLVAKVDTYLMMTERDNSNNTISYAVNYNDTENPVFNYFDFRYPVNGILKTNSQAKFVYTILDDIGASSVDLFYSSDNGVSWNTIVSNYPVLNGDSGNTYDWTIPANTPLNNTFKVKISARDSSGNISTNELGPFSVIDGSTPEVLINAPALGAIWDLNSTHSINWSAVSPNGIQQIRLTYYYNNGNSATSIATLSGNPGSYLWTLPAEATYASTTGQIVLDVLDNNLNSVRVKSNYFTIKDASAPPPAPWITPSKITTVPSISTSYTSQNNNSPVIAIDPAGNDHMAYVYVEDNMSPFVTNPNSYPGRIINYTLYYTKRVGTTWSAPVALRTIINRQDKVNLAGVKSISKPRISVSSNGIPCIVWTEEVDSARNLSEVFFSCLNGGIWAPATNISNNSNIGSFTWSSLTQAPINSNDGRVRLAAIGTDIYASGFSYFRRLYKFSTTANSWNQLADVPGNISWDGASDGDVCAYNGLLYAADSSGQFISYNPSSNTWSQKASLLTSGWGLRLRSVGGKIYAVGAGATTDLQEYDPVTNAWSKRAAMPTAREFPAVSTLNNKLQVIGGRNDSSTPVTSFEEYDPATNTWVIKPNTRALSGSMGGAAVVNGKIYLTASDYASIEAYDPNTNLWMPVDRLQSKMGKGDIVAANGSLYVIGDTTTFSRGIFSGTVDTIPKMSWEPRVAIDSNDIAHIFWLDGRHEYGVDGRPLTSKTADWTLFYRQLNVSNGVWTSISTPLGIKLLASEYDFAVSSDNTLHLVFEQYDSVLGRNTVSYVHNGGTGWGTPLIALYDYTGNISNISFNIGTDRIPKLIGRNDNYLPSTERLFFSSLLNGVWTSPETVVSGSDSSYSQSHLLTDAAGSPIVVYKQDNNQNVYITKRRGDGTWSNGIAANSSSQTVGSFDAAIGAGFNTLHLPYTSSISGHDEVFFNIADLGIDFVQPSISFSGPVIPNTLIGGSTVQIFWSGSDDNGISSVTLKYTTDGGITYTTIATEMSASGSFSWVVPDIAAGTVQIVVVANDGAGNQGSASSTTITIVPKKLTALTISGADVVDEGTAADYVLTAYYDNGRSAIITGALSLTTTPFATLIDGTLTGKPVSTDQTVTLNANFATGGVTKSVNKPVTIRNVSTDSGFLTVTITPPEAVAAGLKWSVDGGITWNNSGTKISLPSGRYLVVFKSMPGWMLPSINNVVVQTAQSISLIGNISLAGDLNGNAEIDLADAITALQVLNGVSATPLSHWYDVNGDQIIGIEEAIFILNTFGVAGQP